MAEAPNNNQIGPEDLDAAGTNAPVSFQDGATSTPPPAGKARKSGLIGGSIKNAVGNEALKMGALAGGSYASKKLDEKTRPVIQDYTKLQDRVKAQGLKDAIVGRASKPDAKLAAQFATTGGKLNKLTEGNKELLEATHALGTKGLKGLDDITKGVKVRSGSTVDKLGAKGVESLAKYGTGKAASLATRALPVVGDVDFKGGVKAVKNTAKELAKGNIFKAAKTLRTEAGKVAAVTTFRLSYDPLVIGGTVGLSLFVTLIVGNLLLFVPESSVTFLEKLGVIALDILLFFFVVICILGVIVMMCSGLNGVGLALKAASLFSNTASSANEVCKTFSVFNVLSGGFGK